MMEDNENCACYDLATTKHFPMSSINANWPEEHGG